MLVQNRSLACYTPSRFHRTTASPNVLLIALLVSLSWAICWLPVLAAAPEMDVYSGGVAISDGSTTPQAYDCTDFGAANIEGVGLSCQYQIYNSGDADLNNVTLTITGAQKDDFSIDYMPDAIIAPGSSSFFQVTFYPKAVGTRRATIRITSNDSDESPYTFAIAGQVAPAEIDVLCYSTGIAIPDGDTTPSPHDCTDFGNANVDDYSALQQFELRNTGNDYLRDLVVTITGANADDFSLYDATSGIIAPGSSDYIQIYFTPKSAGIHQAIVSIASSDSDENPYTFVIQGTATPAEIDVYCDNTGVAILNGNTTPDSNTCTDFDNANVDGYVGNYQFGIYNTGNDYLRNVTVTLTGAGAEHFALYDPNGAAYVVAPGTSAPFYLGFAPKSVGVHQATVRIASSDGDENPYTFVIQGTATPAEIAVTHEGGAVIPNGSRTTSINDCTDFGATDIHQSVTYCRFIIANQGNDYLRNVKVEITGADADAFPLYLGAGETIAPQNADHFGIYFYPTKVGLHKAVVKITSSDSDENPYTFAIQGKATGPLTIAITAEPATPARNFRFTTNSRGTLGAAFFLDPDVYYGNWPYGDSDGDGIWHTKTSNGIAAGNYHVTAHMPFFWGVYGIDCDTPALITREGPSINFNLAGSAGLSCTYQLKRSALIRVQNFHDQNGNGRRNSTEPYLPNWRFTLQDGNGAVIQSLMTNDLGKGTFTDLAAGDYTICVEVLNGWRSTAPGGTPACYTRTVTWGNILTLNFGNRASNLNAAAAEESSAVVTPDELLTTPDDAELSEGDQTWLTTAEGTEATEVQRYYLPTVMQ